MTVVSTFYLDFFSYSEIKLNVATKQSGKRVASVKKSAEVNKNIIFLSSSGTVK